MVRDKPLHNFLFDLDKEGLFKGINVWCTPWIDVCCLLSLVRFHNPKNLLEIGTHEGYTTKILSDKFPDLKITTFDPGDKIAPVDRPANQRGEFLSQDKIGRLVKDKENVKIVKEDFLSAVIEEKFDFIFVDGNHDYDAVVADTKKSLELLNPNGVIVWHDFGNVKYVKEGLSTFNLKNPITSLHNTWIAYYES